MRKIALLCLVVLLFSGSVVMAQDHAKAPAESGMSTNSWIVIAIGFGLAIAVIGGTTGQSRAIAASVEAMARQPEAGGRIFGAMFLGLALIESLVIYMWVTTFLLLGNFQK